MKATRKLSWLVFGGAASPGTLATVTAATLTSTALAAAQDTPAASARVSAQATGAATATQQQPETAAAADEGTEPASARSAETYFGFEPGFRAGFEVPVGGAGDDFLGNSRDLSDLATWRTPFWVDLNYRWSESTAFGIYGQAAFGGTGDACLGDCTFAELRIGAQGQLHLSPGEPLDPWIGIGLGYQWLTFRDFFIIDPETGTTQRTAENLSGPELLLQGGLDFEVQKGLAVGPYLASSLSAYIGDRQTCSTQPTTTEAALAAECPDLSAEGQTFHAWIGLGLRGTYSP